MCCFCHLTCPSLAPGIATFLSPLLCGCSLLSQIHKVHHEFTAPFSLTSEYAHWAELVFGFAAPMLAGFAALGVVLNYRVHVVFMWLNLLWVQLMSSDGHSGYYLPWQHTYWPPFSFVNGGAPHHDLHHELFNCNYGGLWIDRLMGTYVPGRIPAALGGGGGPVARVKSAKNQ